MCGRLAPFSICRRSHLFAGWLLLQLPQEWRWHACVAARRRIQTLCCKTHKCAHTKHLPLSLSAHAHPHASTPSRARPHARTPTQTHAHARMQNINICYSHFLVYHYSKYNIQLSLTHTWSRAACSCLIFSRASSSATRVLAATSASFTCTQPTA